MPQQVYRFRLPAELIELLRAQAKRSAFARNAIRAVFTSGKIPSPEHRGLFRRLSNEVNAIGTNVNQLARMMHRTGRGRPRPDAAKLDRPLAHRNDVQVDLAGADRWLSVAGDPGSRPAARHCPNGLPGSGTGFSRAVGRSSAARKRLTGQSAG